MGRRGSSQQRSSAAADPAAVNDAEYSVAWTATSRRALTRLPEKVATAAVEFTNRSMAEAPRRVGKPLRFGPVGLHSARRGDYKVIYRIDVDLRTVTVMAIEHRSDAYRQHQG